MSAVIAAIISGLSTIISAIILVKVGQVHHIVNQQRTDGQKYQEDLRSALSTAGVAIPPDASLADNAQKAGTET